MREVLEERNFPVSEFYPVASERSVGKKLTFCGKEYTVMSVDDGVAARPDLAIFSAGAAVSPDGGKAAIAFLDSHVESRDKTGIPCKAGYPGASEAELLNTWFNKGVVTGGSSFNNF